MTWNFIPRPFRREKHALLVEAQIGSALRVSSGIHIDTRLAARPDTLFLSRQAIFDATEKVRAYQLLVRKSRSAVEVAPKTVVQSARLIVDTLNTFGVQAALGERLAFVSLPEQSLHSDIVSLLPKSNFVLEYPAEFLGSANAEARCEQLLAQGFNLARICTNGENDLTQVSKQANYVVYDLARQSIQEIVRLDRGVKPQGLIRLVRSVNTHRDFLACKAFGFDLYQGHCFAETETLASRRVDPSRARVVDIFNLVMNKAELGLIEDAFKHDVALCYSLLCYINSVGIGMQYRVASIKNAILLLGYDFLWRWLSLLVYAGIDLSAAQRVLLNTAIIRGRLTELLGQMKLPAKEANTLFVVGNFSLLDALLGLPMEQALTRINLPEDVVKALAHQQGKYAPYLELALAFESNQLGQAERLCTELDIDLTAASQAHIAAIEWAGIVAK
jgi:EAL and modified HD-GYP domain-containing signal transduction protein